MHREPWTGRQGGESPANEITRTAWGRAASAWKGVQYVSERPFVVARGRSSRSSRQSEGVLQRGRFERGDDWGARNTGNLVSETQPVPTLEADEDEHHTAQQSDEKPDDACFDGQAVLGYWLDGGLLKYPCRAGGGSTRKLRVGDLAGDPVELQRDLVLLALERAQQNCVLLPGARCGSFDGDAVG